MTGKLPFDDIYKEALVVLSVTKGNLPSVANNEDIGQLCAIMARCWSMDPEKRPTAGECERSIFWLVRLFQL